MDSPAKILVVDDERVNRQVLSEFLRDDYEIILAKNGLQALQRLEAAPDIALVLLDIMMPELDGYKTLGRIKANDALQDIPVIFISALDSVGDEEKGLRLGAADYISKPFQLPLVRLRIEHHLLLQRQYRELNSSHLKLERLVEQRTRELIQAEKMASLGTLAAGMAHEINNPIAYIHGNIEGLSAYLNILLPLIADYREIALTQGTDNPALRQRFEARLQGKDLDFLLDDIGPLIADVLSGTQRISDIVRSLNNFADRGLAPAMQFDLNACVDEALSLTRNEIMHKASVERHLHEVPLLMGNEGQITHVLVNLLSNAAQAIATQGRIHITTEADSTEVTLRVRDSGCGIRPEDMGHLFDPFFSTREVGQGSGLGLSISHGIIEQHGGSIRVHSELGRGTEFTIVLPLAGTTPRQSGAVAAAQR